MTPEFSRPIDVRHIEERPHALVADEAERAALAERLGIVTIDRLEAEVQFAREGEAVLATGKLDADFVQSCAVSGEPLTTRISEPLELRFVQAREALAEDIELTADDCDEIEYEGQTFDLGEAIAQTLALAIDPYAVGPEADTVRREVGIAHEEAPRRPFAEALSKLKK